VSSFLLADEMEEVGKARPKLMKSKSAAPNTLFKNVEFTIHPDAIEPVSFKPKAENGAVEINGYHEDQAIADEENDDRRRGKNERSNSFGRYKRLEARPLRRSSIASVRKSDKTVRDKGRGYTFDDGLGDEGDSKKKGLPPLKVPSRDQARKAADSLSERPSTPSATAGVPKGVAVDINMDDTPPDERKKKDKEERQSVVDAVKTAAAGKSWLKKQDAQEGMVQKLGTVERRKVKQRRAMYPPLSMVFNPEDKETKDALEGMSQITNGKQHMHVKVVDISLDDDTPTPSIDKNTPGKAKAGPKTVSMATTNEPTSPPRSSTSPSSPRSPTHYRPRKPTDGSLVASRAARLTNLFANDFRPPTVKDKWAEREERKKPSPVKDEAAEKIPKEEEVAPAGSPSAQRRSLPRVPAEEPFHSTKETTKIVQRKQTGKPKFHFGKHKKGDKKTKKEAEDMGFVVVDLQDGLSTPERGMRQMTVVSYT